MRYSSHGLAGAGRVEQPASWPVKIAASSNAAAESVAAAVRAATALVWVATCRRYPGTFQVAVRYLGPQCDTLDLGDVFAWPIQSIDAIKQIDTDGSVVEMDPDSWRFDRPDILIRQDIDTGSRWFPCQNPYRAVSYPGSWWIEGTIGVDPPPDVTRAAELLAGELLLADVDPENCSLPDKVRSISRQGTTIEFDRTLWAGVPLMQEITQPYPVGHGCGAADSEFGRDPASQAAPRLHPRQVMSSWPYRSWKGRWWAEVPAADVPAVEAS